MKFVISKQELSTLINKIQNIVPQKATVPILSNFLLEAANDELILTATDLTVGVRCYASAKIFEEGSTTLPAKRFAQLLRELTSPNIEITTNSNEVTEIVANSSRFKINGMSKSEFPALPDLSNAVQFSVKQKDLRDALYRTAFAVSREDNRYVLTGVLMRIGNATATFVGTDGKRLARARLVVPLDPTISGDYIIPLKAVEEILKSVEPASESLATIYLMLDKIAVEANQTLLISKLLLGDFPDVDRVIPPQPETCVVLHREELMTLLRQVSLFVNNANSPVRFALSPGELRITANSVEGEGKVSMPVNYQGGKLEIAFNPGFFLDILRHSEEETVTLGITDSFNPGLIVEKEVVQVVAALSNPLFVLMPMRLNEETD